MRLSAVCAAIGVVWPTSPYAQEATSPAAPATPLAAPAVLPPQPQVLAPGPVAPAGPVIPLEPVAALLPPVPWLQASLRLSFALTDNGNLEDDANKRSDAALTLRPELRIARRGSNFGLTADVAADFIAHSDSQQQDRVLPDARVAAEATIVDKLLFIDGSADVRSLSSDPYRGSADVLATRTSDVLSTYRVSPHLEHSFSADTSVSARVEESLSTSTAQSQPDLHSTRAVVLLKRDPLPLGGSVELSHQRTRYGSDDAGSPANPGAASGDQLSNTALRGTITYGLGGELWMGGIVGAEHTQLDGASVSGAATDVSESDPIFGVQMRWVPSPRTQVSALVEKRFFGAGWAVDVRHRLPFTSFALSYRREPVGFSAQSTGSGFTDLTSAVDAVLASRYPDPVQRQAQVEQLIATRDLRTTLPDAVAQLADYAQLRTKLQASALWLRPRDSISLTGYRQVLQRLPGLLGTA